MRVLLVEDEIRLAENIAAALAADGDSGAEFAEIDVYDAIVLDLMLPGRDGKSIL